AAHPAAAGRCFRRTAGGAPPDSDVACGPVPPAWAPGGGVPGADQQLRQVMNPVQQMHFRTQGECDSWICAARATMRHRAGLDGWLKQTGHRGGGSSNIGPDAKLYCAVRLPVAGRSVPDTGPGCCQPNCSRCCGQAHAQQQQIFCPRQAARSQASTGVEATATNADVSIDAGVKVDRIVGCFNGTIIFGSSSSNSQLCTRSPGSNSMPGPSGLWGTTPSYTRPYPHQPYYYPYPYPYRVPGQPIPAYCYRPGCMCNSAYRYRCDNFDFDYSGHSHDYVYANGSIMEQRNPCSYGSRREVLQAAGGLTRSLSHPPMLGAVHNRHLSQYGLQHPSTQQGQGNAAWIRTGTGTGTVPLRRYTTAPAAALAFAHSGLPSAPAIVHAVKDEARKATAVGNAEVTAVTAAGELKRTSSPGIAAANACTLAGAAAIDSKERKAVEVRPSRATSSVIDQAEQHRRQQQRELLLMHWPKLATASSAAAAHDGGSGPPSLPTPAVAGPARPRGFGAPGHLDLPWHHYSTPPVLSPSPTSRLPTAASGGESNPMRCSYPNDFIAAKYGGAAAAAVVPVTARTAPGGSIAAATDVHNTPSPAGAGEILNRLAGMQRAARVEPPPQQQPSEVLIGTVQRGTSTGAGYAPKPIMAARRRSRDDMEQGDQGWGGAWGGLNPCHPEIARYGGKGGYLEEEEERSCERPNKRGPADTMARLPGFCLNL
ncbi:hypothetical protein Vafri_186, partial [Volvox africanus]